MPQLAKSLYALAYGAASARTAPAAYDHVLAYWGNYAATSALIYSQLSPRPLPFSLFLHAGVDLYRDRILLERKLRAARNIFVVCDFNRQFLEAEYPSLYREIEGKIHLHHLGIELAEYAFHPKRRFTRRIVAVGRLCKPKGFDVLIRALAILRAREVPVEVEFVGGGPELERYRKLAASLNVAAQVKFLGWLPPEQTREQIAEATVLAHPSTMLGDAVPTVIKEAMSLGTPVVASRIAGIPELLDDGNCGLLVEPGDPAALAGALEQMVTNGDLRARFADAARRRAEALFDLWANGRRLAALLATATTDREEPAAAAVA